MSNGVDGGPTRPVTEQSTAELVQHASEQVSRLMRDELALARSELTDKMRHAGFGAGLFGGGGVMAHFGVAVLLAAAVLGLAQVMPAWLAAVIVGVALLVVAAIMALIGRRQVRQAVPPMPQSVAQGVRADMDTLTTAVRNRGR